MPITDDPPAEPPGADTAGTPRHDAAARRALLQAVQAAASPSPGASAARSQDFLYDEHGLPG